jgi:hypothetical protein
MKLSLIASLGLVAGGFAGAAYAQEVPAAPPAAKSDTPVKTEGQPKQDAKADNKDDAETRVRLEFDANRRMQTAFYSNSSQARLKIYTVNRFDAEIAKAREYFFLELSGAAIIEPLKLDADDTASINAIVSILERFQSESEKSGKLKEDMVKRKVALEGDLSREETRLVELQSAPAPDVAAIDASKAQITKLKDGLTLAVEIGSMTKISGVMGKAKVNLDRPAYEFVASFEPGKSLYTLSAGYSFQVAAKDVKFYVDLLKRTQEFKSQLLENESKGKKLRQEVESLFQEKKL